MNAHPRPITSYHRSDARWSSTVKRMTSLLSTAVALLAACQDPDGSEAPQFPTDPAAAAVAAGLNAPSNASAVALSETQIDLSWQENSPNETGFQVHRSTTGEPGTFTLLTTTGTNVTAYRDQGLQPGTQYCYRVRAVRVNGINALYSAFSNTACATTLALPPPPPSNASAVALSETQIDISWQDNSSNETRFQVYRSMTGNPSTFALLATTGADVLTYRNEGLAALTQYCYQVRAVRVSGINSLYSAFSNTACATTLAPPPPAAASGTIALPSSSSTVSVSWTDNSSNEDGFRLDRSIDTGAVWDLAATVGAGTQGWGGYDPLAEQRVCYRVVAFNASGDAPPSDMACTTPPAAPTNLTATVVDVGLLDLAWNDNSSVEDTYQVWVRWFRGSYYCYPPGYQGAVDMGTVEGEGILAELPANSTTYRTAPLSDPDCDPPTYYWFYVVATKDGGASGPSNEVSASPPDGTNK